MTSIFIPGSGDCQVITKSDTENIRTRTIAAQGGSSADTTQAIYVGGTGNMKVLTSAGQTVLFESIPAGTLLPVRATKVFDTDTTATKMVALF